MEAKILLLESADTRGLTLGGIMNRVTEFISRIGLGLALLAFLITGAAAQNTGTSDTNTNAGRQASSTSSTTKGSANQLDTADRTFVKKAAEGGLAEVELGQLATQKASDDEVKKFGQRMVDDHTKANDQLKQVAATLGVQVPDHLSAKDQATKDRLQKLSGAQFDRAYMNDMVKDHTKDVVEFRHASKMAKNSEVKNFASQTLPTLEDHLKEAKNIAPKENKQASNSHKPSAANPQR
jgi:putative membrane protein